MIQNFWKCSGWIQSYDVLLFWDWIGTHFPQKEFFFSFVEGDWVLYGKKQLQSDCNCSLGSVAEPWWASNGKSPKIVWLFNAFKTIKHLTMALKTIFIAVCYYHITHMFQSESTLYICLNVKEVYAWNKRIAWSDSNRIRTHNHFVCKQTLNHLAKVASLAYELSACEFKSCYCSLYTWLTKLYQFISNLFFLGNIPTSGQV